MLFNNIIHIQQVHFAIEMREKPRIDEEKKLKSTAVPIIFFNERKSKYHNCNVSVTYN